MPTRRLELVPLTDLKRAPVNPKRHHASLGESVSRFGYVEPVVVDERTGCLVAGHGRLDDLESRRREGQEPPDGVEVGAGGEWLVPTLRGWASRSDDDAAAYVVASNRIGEAGGWDEQGLAELLGEHRGDDDWLLGTGYDAGEVDALLASAGGGGGLPEPGALTDPDDVPEVPDEPVTQPGDLWLLGPHRLICGDCRDSEAVARVMGDAVVNVAFTSPPYADRRTYDESSGFRPIPPDEYVEWFDAVQANVAAHLAQDGSWFVNIKPGVTPDSLSMELYVFDLVLAHARLWGWNLGTEYCWERNGVPKAPVMRFKNQWESVFHFARGRWKWRPDEVRHWSANVPVAAGPGVGSTTWADNQGGNGPIFGHAKRRQHGTTTLMADAQGTNAAPGEYTMEGLAYPGNRLPTFAGSHDALGHTAAFPVGLPAFFVKAYSDSGDTVFDPFAGSGSTLIAAHQTDRVGLAVEISPGYCDVVCRRFQSHTDEKPILERTGEPHDFLA